MPALPAHEINARVWRRNRERCNDHWSGARPKRTSIAAALCAYCWQKTFLLVGRILRDERSNRSIDDLFRSGVPMFSRKKFERQRSRSIPGRDSQLLFLDG